MIKSGAIIGHTNGMETAASCFLSSCQNALYYRDLQGFLQQSAVDPQLILVLQHWPDEFRSSEIQQLLVQFPVSRLICCYSQWCASMGRSRNDWPPAVCVPLESVVDRINAEVQVINGARTPLERTAGLDELFEFDHRPEHL